jgi:2-methylcitrate dehydratase PrpD
VSLTRDLVEAVWSIRFDNLSDADLAAVRMLLLDYVGVTANGSGTESARAAERWAASLGSDGTSFPVIGRSHCLSAVPAALANAVAGHSIEYDDVHNAASLHPAVVIFPTAMAAATIADADAASFITGVVRGYEVMCRVGRAARPEGQYARNFHPTATAGHIGAAASAASLFGLDETQTTWALGIASTMAAGGMEFLVDGSWTKRFHPALAVQNGINAARLAAEGYFGGDDGVGGPRGFLATYSAEPDPDLLLAGFGAERLEVAATSVKAHTCCRYNQGPIDALLSLRSANSLSADDVASIVIGLPTVAVGIVAEPSDAKARPKNVVEAQFSLPFGAAVALARGRAGLTEYTEAVLRDPSVLALMDVVRYEIDPVIDLHYPAQWRAWAEVTTTDGRQLRAAVTDPKGDPANPLSHAEAQEKFEELTAGCWDAERQSLVSSLIEGLGGVGTISALSRAMTLE